MIKTYKLDKAPLDEIISWLKRASLNDKRYTNYLNLEFDENYLAISVVKNKDDFEAFSSLFKRDFFPDNCYRILNRYFVDPKYRIGNRKIFNDVDNLFLNRTLQMISQQIYHAKKYNAQSLFLSLHSYMPRYARKVAKFLSIKTEYDWKVRDLVLVFPAKNNRCYQHVVYTNLTNTNIMKDFLDNKITLSEWKKL